MEAMSLCGYTAKNLSTLLVDECNRLYGGEPGDDATACVVRVRRRVLVPGKVPTMRCCVHNQARDGFFFRRIHSSASAAAASARYSTFPI